MAAANESREPVSGPKSIPPAITSRLPGIRHKGGNDKQRSIDQISLCALMAEGVLKQMQMSQQIVETDAVADNGQRGHQREKSQPLPMAG